MRTLVVGASGLIGGALVRALSLASDEVMGTYCSRPRTGASIQLDIRDRQAVSRCIENAHPTVVILASGVSGQNNRDANIVDIQDINLRGTKHVADAATTAGAQLVYYSTDRVFDCKSGPYSEDDVADPVDALGTVKLQAENVVRSTSSSNLVIRTSDVFGWDRESDNRAMRVWDELQAGRTIEATSDEHITPTLVDYLAEVTVRLIQAEETGLVHVANAEIITPFEFSVRLARILGLDCALVLHPCKSAETKEISLIARHRGLKVDRLYDLLATTPPSLDECFRRLRRHHRIDTHSSYGPHEASDSTAGSMRAEILEKVREFYVVSNPVSEFVPFESRINYAGRVFAAEEMTNLVDSALDFWLTMGPYAERFEESLRRYFGAGDAVIVSSGSAANLTSILTMMSPQLERPLVPGDEVITPAVTFPTTLAPIVHSGLTPVFVDCTVGTYNVDPTLLEDAMSAKTRAIVVPHTLGNPCDMDVILGLAKRHELFLMEDSCDALGSTFRGRLVGTFGDLATLSFFPAHHITTGEGGCVVANSPRLARIARSVRDWGRDCWCAPGESNSCGKRFGWQCGELPKGYDHKFTYSNLGYNFKPTDMQAAVGLAQMARLPAFIAARRRNFARLYEGLQPYQDRVVLPTLDPRSDPSWFGFPITVMAGSTRAELVHWLEKANIETRMIFGGNILRQPGYKNIRHRIAGRLVQTDRVMRDSFFVGVYPGLSEEILEFMLERFAAFFDRS